MLPTEHATASVLYPHAGVVELADTPDLGSGAARFGGSSPPSRILVASILVARILVESETHRHILLQRSYIGIYELNHASPINKNQVRDMLPV